jgi:heat shock protein HslJ
VHNRPLLIAVLAVLALALAACGGTADTGGTRGGTTSGGDDRGTTTTPGDGDASAPDTAEAPRDGADTKEPDASTGPAGAWLLVAADPPIEVPADARVTLEVVADGDVWQVGGTSACNSYFGTVRTDGSAWTGDGYGQTEMACDEPRMATERTYLDALTTVEVWTRPTADELVLSGPDAELRFAALPAVPIAALTGTTWLLEGLIVGTGPDGAVSSTVSEADEATLRLDPDGVLAASTGCRTFDGEWVERGDEVLLTTFGETDDSPNVAADGPTTCGEAVIAQEDHVLSVLGDRFRAEVDGQRLTLSSREGLGLSYVAADASDGEDHADVNGDSSDASEE